MQICLRMQNSTASDMLDEITWINVYSEYNHCQSTDIHLLVSTRNRHVSNETVSDSDHKQRSLDVSVGSQSQE